MTFPWLKGHGTRNDFVLLPDPDGTVHGELDAAFVAALCDRRSGVGADGVIRVIRTEALTDPAARGQEAAEWFMDYRNADGSISEMCGNGVRVFVRHLLDAGLVDGRGIILVGTRDGIKTVRAEGDQLSVDLGVPELRAASEVAANGHRWKARDVRTGNPHAVSFVEDIAEAGTLIDAPTFDAETYPDGVNLEFVQRLDTAHIAMRVFERGSGETQSCGTGAVAAAVATMDDDGAHRPATYRVDVPGGTVHVTWHRDGSATLGGPATICARGEMEWLG